MIVDSNVIIYAIKPEFRLLRTYLVSNADRLHVSSITRLESLGFHRLTTDEVSQFDELFQITRIVGIDEAVISEAIRLRQQRRRSLGDSIIAATALLYNLPVLTNNVADFADVDGVQVIALADILNA